MDIMVTFRRLDPSESLRAYAEEKISKLNKYFDTPAEAHIVLAVEKHRHQADVTLTVDGERIKGVEETGDMYSAIDQVMDKIEKQVKRHLSRIRERRPEGGKGAPEAEMEEVERAEILAQEDPVIIVEHLDAKPMDTEEAAMQLSMSEQEFLVFRNAKTMNINVLYKRKGGNLGLIEPSA